MQLEHWDDAHQFSFQREQSPKDWSAAGTGAVSSEHVYFVSNGHFEVCHWNAMICTLQYTTCLCSVAE